jgi:hypothetical protein
MILFLKEQEKYIKNQNYFFKHKKLIKKKHSKLASGEVMVPNKV